MIIAFVVLAITLPSLLAAGLPVITAIVGVLIGVRGLTALSGVFEVSDTAPILATMLGLAVGIVYALEHRRRTRRRRGGGAGDRHRRHLPGRLGRLVPNLDIEGERLVRDTA
jgi:putative drug exporter of the RND superfamily